MILAFGFFMENTSVRNKAFGLLKEVKGIEDDLKSDEKS